MSYSFKTIKRFINGFRNRSNRGEQAPRALLLQNLEERVLYDASPLGCVAQEMVEAQNIEQSVEDTFTQLDELSLAYDGISENEADQINDPAPLLVEAEPLLAIADEGRNLIVIDSRLTDYDLLVADLEASQIAFDLIELDETKDGIEQITTRLNGEVRYGAVHIIGHGEHANLQLGSTELSASNINDYQAELFSWRTGLTGDADILLYGCDVAQSAEGIGFIDRFTELTGADIAASDDVTGSAKQGGDWEFEYTVGAIQSDVLFSAAVQESWQGTLATITVTTLDDVVDGNVASTNELIASPGDDGVISLREAILAANANPDVDTILIGSGVHRLTIPGDGFNTGDFRIVTDIAVIGSADGSSIIDANGIDQRVFYVQNGGELTLRNLTIQGGGPDDMGTLGGGGIRIDAMASAELENVVVRGNAFFAGGGIQSAGTLSVLNSTIDGNRASDSAGGGGISLVGGMATLVNVTVSNNAADSGTGGGVEISGGTHSFENLTVSGNSSTGGGAGIQISGGVASFNHVTVTDNAVSNGLGGGILVTSGDATLSNSIVAGNTASASIEIASSLTSGGNNIVGDDPGDSVGGFVSVLTDVFDDPNLMLDPNLTDNGGPVQTHALLPGSLGIVTNGQNLGALVPDDIGTTNAPPTSTLVDLPSIEENSSSVTITQTQLLSEANDLEGGPLQASDLVILSGRGTVIDSGNGSFEYIPEFGDASEVRFGFSITDGTNTIDAEARLDITERLTGILETQDVTVETDEDSAVVLNLSGSTTNGIVEEFRIVSLPSHGTLFADSNLTEVVTLDLPLPATANQLDLFYVPDLNFNGQDTFQYAAIDNQQSEDTTPAVVQIDILPINDEEEIVFSGVLEVTRGQTNVVIGRDLLLTTDVDNTANELIYTVRIPNAIDGTLFLGDTMLVSGSQFTQADVDAGLLTYNHSGSERTSDWFGFSVNDGSNDSHSANFNIRVSPAATAPVNIEQVLVSSGPLNLLQGATGVVIGNDVLLTTDADNSNLELIYTIEEVPVTGTLLLSGNVLGVGAQFTQADIENGRLTYNHDGSEIRNDSFQFAVDDGTGLASSATFDINIDDVNDAPTFTTPDQFMVNENLEVIAQFNAADVDDDNLVFSLTGNGPDDASFLISNDGQLSFNGTPDFEQPADTDRDNVYQIEVQVDDGRGGVQVQTVAVEVLDVNELFVFAVNRDFSVANQGQFTFQPNDISVLDPDSQPAQIIYTLDSVPATGQLLRDGQILAAGDTFTQLDLNSGLISFSHLVGPEMVDGFTFSVTDGENTQFGQSIDISIGNAAPVGANDQFTVLEDNDLTGNVLLNDVDIDTDALTALVVNEPRFASRFELSPDGTFIYTPNANFTGTDSFVYVATDGSGVTTEVNVEIGVLPVNDAPTATSDSFAIAMDETNVILDVIANDVDLEQDGITAVILSQPANGRVEVLPDGNISYRPNLGFVGTDQFTYAPSDTLAQGSAVRVELTVGDLSQLTVPNENPQIDDSPDIFEPQINDSVDIFEPLQIDDSLQTENSNLIDEPTSVEAEGETNLDSDPSILLESIPVGGALEADGADTFNHDAQFTVKPAEDFTVVGYRYEFANEVGDIDNVATRLLCLICSEPAAGVNQKVIDELNPYAVATIAYDAQFLWKQIDELETSFESQFYGLSFTLGAVSAFGGAGYILWTLRGGMLMAAAIPHLPNWKLVDPLPILDSYVREGSNTQSDDVTGFFE